MSAAFGDPSEWAPIFESIHDCMLEKLAIAWPRCTAHFRGAHVHEQKVTNKLVVELRKANREGGCRIPGRIESDHTLLEETIATGAVGTKGYVDMVVLVGDEESVYMAYENKWLNVRDGSGARRPQAGEYVRDGLMRYVREQYSSLLPWGYMLGFVLDGDLTHASSSIEAVITTRKTELLCSGAGQWERIANCPATMERRWTKHARKPNPITIDHILLDFSRF